MMRAIEDAALIDVVFARTGSIADAIESLIRAGEESIGVALYSFNNQRLAGSLFDAERRGLRVRLVVDHTKYKDSPPTRELLADSPFPVRLSYGRDGERSKMHHKFLLVDDKVVLTGSYNWTVASEEENYENLLILREPRLVDLYGQEFEVIWEKAQELPKS